MKTSSVLRSAALALVMVLLSGCGTLKVTMGVLKPEVIRAEVDRELVDKLLPTVLGSTDQTIVSDVEKLRDAHKEVYVRLRKQYEQRAATLADPAQTQLLRIARSLTNDFDSNTARLYGSLSNDLQQYRATIINVNKGTLGVRPGDDRYQPTVDALLVWHRRVAQASTLIEGDIASKVQSASAVIAANRGGGLSIPDLKAIVAAEKATIQAEKSAVNAYLSQLSVQNSPVAFAVANAKDEDWATRYNYVNADSYGGAADVAIKLDPSTGNYLLKGLSFDPSDVAAVASKVTTQALLVSAQLAGVPIKSPSPPAAGAAGAALATSSGALADAQASLETRRAQDEARKVALLAIANVILNEEQDFKSADANTRKAAIAAIRRAFETRQAILRSSSTP